MCLGLILDADGQKMSKSKGNTVEPWQVLDAYGADAFRWYFFTSKQPWDGYRFSIDAIAEGVRLFLKQLWSTYYFYTLYAHASAAQLSAPAQGRAARTRWTAGRCRARPPPRRSWPSGWTPTTRRRPGARSRRSSTSCPTGTCAARAGASGTATATRSQTLRTCLVTVARLLAPFCPFIADEIYDNLDGTLASVHLCDFPAPEELPARDEPLEQAMALARETVRLGLGARGKAKIKVRQPLGEAVVVAHGREREAIEALAEVVREELNVRRVRFVAAAEELGSYEVKANYRTLGPLFGKDMPLAADAIAALDPTRVAAAVRDGDVAIGVTVAGREHVLSAGDVILTMRPPDGYSVEREGAHAVALDLAIDDDLRREGRAREIVHAVQNARKSAGLAVEDRVHLTLDGDAALIGAARAHRDYLSGETLAVELTLVDERAVEDAVGLGIGDEVALAVSAELEGADYREHDDCRRAGSDDRTAPVRTPLSDVRTVRPAGGGTGAAWRSGRLGACWRPSAEQACVGRRCRG